MDYSFFIEYLKQKQLFLITVRNLDSSSACVIHTVYHLALSWLNVKTIHAMLQIRKLIKLGEDSALIEGKLE